MAGLLLAGCADGLFGTAVGNPGDLDVVARVTDGAVTLSRVEVPIDVIELTSCGNGEIDIVTGGVLDGLAASDMPLVLPGGDWCAIFISFDGAVLIEGETSAETMFLVELALPTLALSGRVEVDENELILDLALPLEADVIDELGPDVVVMEGDPVATDWSEDAADLSTVWLDVDEDGLIETEADQQRASVDLGVARGAGQSGCGCTTTPTGLGLWLTLPWLLLRRRSSAGPRLPREAT